MHVSGSGGSGIRVARKTSQWQGRLFVFLASRNRPPLALLRFVVVVVLAVVGVLVVVVVVALVVVVGGGGGGRGGGGDHVAWMR